MTREAELRFKYDPHLKVWCIFGYHIADQGKTKEKALLNFIKGLVLMKDCEKQDAITETNSKWKQAIQKTLKELKQGMGTWEEQQEFIDTTFKKHLGGLAE